MNRFSIARFAVFSIFGATTALAAVAGVTGNMILMPAPPSVVPGAAFVDTTVVHSFVERQDFVLPAAVPLDRAPRGQPLVIPAGTCVWVYYLHYDPTAPAVARGEMQFDGTVLGVIETQATLIASDALLGNPSTAYPAAAACTVPPPGGGNCAPESNDSVTIQPQSIAVEFHANGPGDRVRVITGCDCETDFASLL